MAYRVLKNIIPSHLAPTDCGRNMVTTSNRLLMTVFGEFVWVGIPALGCSIWWGSLDASVVTVFGGMVWVGIPGCLNGDRIWRDGMGGDPLMSQW